MTKSANTTSEPPEGVNRRQFVQLIAALSVGWPAINNAASSPTVNQHLSVSDNSSDYSIEALNRVYQQQLKDPWLTLASVQQHLFPSGDSALDDSTQFSPGAADINALGFLRNMLAAPDISTEQKDFILNGAGWLNDLSKKNHQQIFIELEHDKKEQILRSVENSKAGGRWLSRMMTYLIEALLSDPVYGGNKNAAGWTWLEHIPGFPTPSTEQVYYKLSQTTRRRTKA